MKKEGMKMNVSVLYNFSPDELERIKADQLAHRIKMSRKEETEEPSRWRLWLKKMGVAGFVFFTVKGLLWLAVPAVAARLMA
jgi:hypothetical protein